MKKLSYLLAILFGSVFMPPLAQAQEFDVSTFDPTSAGPWSSLGKTVLMVPKVANGSVTLDGASSAAEYGGFTGVTVTPGINAWILDFPAPPSWDNAADSSFSFFLAHDDNYFYVGVRTEDEVVNSDDDNSAFWQDDSIEIVVDALLDGFDNNTDNSKDPVGGHNYVNYQGRFSGWDDVAQAKNASLTWASEVDWKYGQTGEIFGFGTNVTGGWQMEVRFKKNLFESTTASNKLANGYFMGFNIGIDDDDKKATAGNGQMEIQYFWANRARYKGVDAAYLETLTPEEKNLQVWRADTDNHPLIIDSAGRLSHAGAGGIVFGYDENRKSTGKILFLGASSDDPSLGDGALIALLQAKGYTVTVVNSAVGPDAIRAAAVGQDVVFISQSLGSGTVLEPIGDPAVQKFVLRDTDIPVISNEAYMYDNAEWTTHPDDFVNDLSRFGNTGRGTADADTQPNEIRDGRDSLYIRIADHAIAKGITQGSNGIAKVFNTHYSLNYGTPGPDAKVVASVESDGKYPTLWVYEKGDHLVDGTVVPNKRIGLYLGQSTTATGVANWDPDVSILTQDGKALLFNTLDYAIGKTVTVPPTISIAKNGTSVVITYAGGTLQSSATIDGTFTTESSASPVTIALPTATKFYRVKAN